MKKIGLIGDSIGQGFWDETDLGWFVRLGRLIKQNYGADYIFNNMSQFGDNIADAYHRAETEVLSRAFDLILVNIGINDLRRRKNSHKELDFSEGVRLMYWNKLLDLLEQTKAKIIITDLLPVVENRYTLDASLIRRNSDVERYNEIISDVCKEHNIAFYARYNVWQKLNLEELYFDATHPNATGHQLLAEQTLAYLKKQNLL